MTTITVAAQSKNWWLPYNELPLFFQVTSASSSPRRCLRCTRTMQTINVGPLTFSTTLQLRQVPKLFRHSTKTAKLKAGFLCTVCHTVLASPGGLHHAAAHISGDDVYRHLKYEGGTHRVQRIPETGLSSRMQRIHTGTMSVIVLPQPEEVNQLQIGAARGIPAPPCRHWSRCCLKPHYGQRFGILLIAKCFVCIPGTKPQFCDSGRLSPVYLTCLNSSLEAASQIFAIS